MFETIIANIEHDLKSYVRLLELTKKNGNPIDIRAVQFGVDEHRAAIKLLEAAGKIDKKKESYCPGGVNPYPLIRSFLCAWSNKRYRGVCDDEKYCEDRNDCRKYKAQILALLDALPGGGR